MGRSRRKRHRKIKEGRLPYVLKIVKTLYGKHCVTQFTTDALYTTDADGKIYNQTLTSLGFLHQRCTFTDYIYNIFFIIRACTQQAFVENSLHKKLDDILTSNYRDISRVSINMFDNFSDEEKNEFINKILNIMKKHKIGYYYGNHRN